MSERILILRCIRHHDCILKSALLKLEVDLFHCTIIASVYVVLLFLDILCDAQFNDVFQELQRASSNLLLKCFCASFSDISNTWETFYVKLQKYFLLMYLSTWSIFLNNTYQSIPKIIQIFL